MVKLRRLLMMYPRRLTLTRLLVLGVLVAVCVMVYLFCDWTLASSGKARVVSDGKGSGRPGSKVGERSGPLDVERVAEYCNIPTEVVEGEEGDAPEDYTLLSAYILIRHGDRTPLASSLLNLHAPSPPDGCNMKAAPAAMDVLRKVPELANFVGDMERQLGRRAGGRGDFARWSLFPQHSACTSSLLTAQGAAQHLLSGLSVRSKYQRRWGLLSPATFSPASHLSVHSTVVSRTYQSALAFVYGLLQPRPPTPATFDLSEVHVQPASNVVFCRSSLVPRACCLSLSKLQQEVDKAIHIPRVKDVDWQAAMPPLAEVFGIKVGKLPGATQLLDFFQGHACHGVALPCGVGGRCVTPAMMSRLWALVDGQGKRTSREPSFDRYARTIMHSLLTELERAMHYTARNRSEVKVTLYSGHDLTLTPMLQTLGLYEGRWPSYATRVVWELYRRASQPSKHFLRVLLNGKDVTPRVTFCRGRTQDGGLCPLRHFQRFVTVDNLQAIGVDDVKGLESFCRSKVLF